ncbi:HNH endonuclease [Cupriavidus sp. WGtm5]|uniref:HNH endonuclease n=1 Tax=Cupriavidus sp. WGtm5 TaxID=2919926 RepID=UPI00209032F1|nr:HNH endonuclease signature motif containing protein [Cupriavidus sp. WGtm5]MCO4887920.1 HNH endonuclease [Cupriavidus sp. WGtm5]
MTKVAHFRNDEGGYMNWLDSNPDGLVLNIRHPAHQYTPKLHRATCGTIKSGKNAPYTSGQYTKLCSHRYDLISQQLLAETNGVSVAISPCGTCKPDVEARFFDEAAGFYAELDAQVGRALRDDVSRRRARLTRAQPKPAEKFVLTRVFDRNPDVIAEVLYRAAGTCESCNSSAPFSRRSTGEPYLEVHHVVPLAKGGDDTVENAIAVCPNCHREQHYG